MPAKNRVELPGFTRRLAELVALKKQELGIRSDRGLALRLGLDAAQLPRWLKGALPTMPNLVALENALGVPWEYLLVGEEGATRILQHLGRAARGPVRVESPDLAAAVRDLETLRRLGAPQTWETLLNTLREHARQAAARIQGPHLLSTRSARQPRR